MIDDRAERERIFFDHLALEHGRNWWGNTTGAGRYRQFMRADMARRLTKMGQGSQVLEVGCGNGEFSCQFENSGAQLTSVDISPALIALAEGRFTIPNIHFKVENVEQIDCEDNTYDAIIGNAILHHLNLEKVLPEFKRVLKPGGVIFFSEPNMMNPLVWLMFHVPGLKRLLEVSEDETAFYRLELEKKFYAYGYRNVSIRPFDFLLPVVPDFMIQPVLRLAGVLEKTVLIKEIGGSLSIFAQK